MRHRLTNAAVSKLHREKSPGRVPDGGSLYLHGGQSWQFRFVWQDKPQTLTLGRYPIVTLAEARKLRDAAADRVKSGTDPRGEKTSFEDTFSAVSGAWLSTQTTVTPKTVERHRRAIAVASAAFGTKSIKSVTLGDVRALFDTIHASGHHGAFAKARVTLGGVWRYAIVRELTQLDPVHALRSAYKLKAAVHFPHLEGAQAIGEFVRRLTAYRSLVGGGIALRLQMLTMVRPGESCGARWAEFEIDGESPMWRIPAERMKKKKPHHVPLSSQAVALLHEWRNVTGAGRLVFPGLRDPSKSLTTAAAEGVVRAIGYTRGELVPHGLRGTASTYLNGIGANRDDIELCLAHVEGNTVRAAYNHATRLPERRVLLQLWGNELDRLALCRDQSVLP